jgi:hypothetical protein
MENFYIEKIQLKANITQYTLWVIDVLDQPAGIVWVRIIQGDNDKRIGLILNMMTANFFQRKGVCTAICNSIIEDVDTMITASGSDAGGKAFLEKYGFKYNPEINIWSFAKAGGK